MSIFDKVPIKRPKFSTFSLSHDVKTTCNMGKNIPILCQEVLPGDRFRVNTELLCRLAPMQAPMMQRVDVYTHFFFVPNRLLWDSWEDFITGGEDGKAAPVFPRIVVPTSKDSSSQLWDYLGVPTDTRKDKDTNGVVVNALPFKAYQLIWNEFYRDQNLQEEIDIHTELDGEQDGTELLKLRNRAWAKDYFTSALPWTQRGGDVQLPIGGSAPVDINLSGDNTINKLTGRLGDSLGLDGYSGSLEKNYSNDDIWLNAHKDGHGTVTSFSPIGVTTQSGSLSGTADLSAATAVTINELRRANALQRWLEKNARGGARYIEQILSHFGVRVADYRLQRPQFLGGGKSPVMVSEVLQSSATGSGDTPQGTMAGHGVSATRNHAFTSQFYEHGFIIGIMSIMPKASYMNGLPRIFGKFDKFDYAFPEFANLGEQPIYNSEVWLDAHENSARLTKIGEESGVFGYAPRYAEYKFAPSSVHGDFRNSLRFWHMARNFDSAPSLNPDFITCNDPNMYRVFAVEDAPHSDHFWVEIFHDIRAIRPLPKYGIPSL